MNFIWMIIIVFLLKLVIISGDEQGHPHVTTKQGILKGKLMKSRTGKNFYGFFKVPYAKPPLGDLRFKVCV